MTIQYQCATCGSAMAIRDDLRGTAGHCPKCKTAFTVPEPQSASAAVDDEITLRADEDEVPARKPSARSRSGEKSAAGSGNGNSPATVAVRPPADQTIQYVCGHCGAAMQIRSDHAGKKKRCPKCKRDFFVPTGDIEDDILNFLSDDAPASSRSSSRATLNDTIDESDESDLDDADQLESETDAPGKQQTVPEVNVPELARKLWMNARKAEEEEQEEADGKKKKGYWGVDKNDLDQGERLTAADTLRFIGTRVLPILLGTAAATFLLYWVVMQTLSRSSGIPPLGQVTGIVTLDGKPLVAAEVRFEPMQEGVNTNNRISGSYGRTDSNGRYTLKYTRDYPGAAVGKHIVRISKTDDAGVEVVPAMFNAKSVLNKEVASGANEIGFPLVSQ